ncbi:MAG: holo-ACP synthase [Mariprofundus sp.]|nr:holo-ACP synthase [Mariprofundus sp.]
MIAGIGIDRIAIARIEAALDRHGERFVQRIYTEREISQARAKGHPARRFAMLFAAKEAVSKALGTGFRQGIALRMIETIHQDSGKPEITLHDAAQLRADAMDIVNVQLSLTDDGGVAMAFALAETGA